jgi:hypothetical protein
MSSLKRTWYVLLLCCAVLRLLVRVLVCSIARLWCVCGVCVRARVPLFVCVRVPGMCMPRFVLAESVGSSPCMDESNRACALAGVHTLTG